MSEERVLFDKETLEAARVGEGLAEQGLAAGRGTEGQRGQPRLKWVNRKQQVLRAVDVEKLVAEDHPARAIWECVGRMDLSAFYKEIRAVEGVAGRAAFDPQLLISVWIYAYSEGIGSAREIEQLCQYHPGFQWLTGMEVINHHSLSDFRVDHKEALDELFVQVLGFLSAEELITLQQVMHDGTKIKACAGADTFRREEKLRLHLEEARQQVEAMGDPRGEEVSRRVAKARERAARERKQRLELAVAELEKVRACKATKEDKEKARVSETDPEARMMKQSDGGYAPSYNVQISTDAEAGIIVAAAATQSGSDYEELVPAVERIEEKLGKAPKQIVTDGGFSSRSNIMALEERGVDLIAPIDDGSATTAAQLNRRGVAPGFGPEAFSYDAATDSYTCPAGQRLKYETKEAHPGIIHYRYRARAADCGACPLRAQCCPKSGSKGRSITRGVEDPVVAAFRQKMEGAEAKAIYRQRGAKAEFPNAWLKEKIGLWRFHLRGLIKVDMEAVWASLAYNIKQWIRLRWRPKTVEVPA